MSCFRWLHHKSCRVLDNKSCHGQVVRMKLQIHYVGRKYGNEKKDKEK